MRIPDEQMVRKFSQLLACIILGFIAGAITVMFMHGHLMNKILLENRQLVSENEKLADDLQLLEKNHQELSEMNQKFLIKRIEIQMINEDSGEIDGFVKTEIQDRLRKDLKFLISLPVENVGQTSDAVHHLVNGRRYEIQQQAYGLKLETLIIYSTVVVKVAIEKIN